MNIQLQNQAGVCWWEVGTLAVQMGTRQDRVNGKRDLSRISKLLLWIALSSLLLLVYNTIRCQGCNDHSALPGVRGRELVCANWGHQSKLLEAWLGMRELFFFLKKKNKKSVAPSDSVKFYFWWGKKSIWKKRCFFSVEGKIWEFKNIFFFLFF